jgi:hypothetical protein
VRRLVGSEMCIRDRNWAAGVYENKPSVTGIRTGHKPKYRAAIGF